MTSEVQDQTGTSSFFHALRYAQGRTPEGAAVILAITVALSIWLVSRYAEQADWIRHTLEVQTQISRIWSSLQDIEIRQRSFVLTGEAQFLTPFVEADKRITQQIDDLAQFVADNPIQVSAINAVRPLVSDRIAFAQNTVQVRQRGDVEGARQLVSQGRGLQLMEDLRKRFDGMQDEETGLLAARTAALHSTINWLLAAIALGVLTTVYVLTVWITTARRNARELAQTNQMLRETIAEREAAEQQIRQMQKMEAIGQLTGGIAHDFNNMLAVIVSGISLARRRLAAGRDGVDGFLASSIEGAQKAAALVARLLAFSRQQTLSPRPIDANRFVAGMSELIARACLG